MARIDEYNLSIDSTFQHRVNQSVLDYCKNTVFLEATNDQQTVSVTGSPTGGSFTLANGPLTSAVAPAFNATAQALAALINAAVAAANSCVCTGGPLPGTGIVVTWNGGLADAPQNVMTVTANNLTGGVSPNASVAHTTVGVAALNHSTRTAFAKLVAASPGSYLFLSQLVAGDATVQTDYLSTNPAAQANVTDAHIDAAVAAQFNLYAGAF